MTIVGRLHISGEGDAGDVRLRADRLALGDGTHRQPVARLRRRIIILVDELIDLENGGMITSVFGGAGTTAGDVSIDPRFIVLDGGRIVAQATQGRGGNIRIIAEQLILSPDGVIDASAERGIDGTVVVSSPEVDLAELRERCASRRDVGASSFTGGGPRRPAAQPGRAAGRRLSRRGRGGQGNAGTGCLRVDRTCDSACERVPPGSGAALPGVGLTTTASTAAPP